MSGEIIMAARRASTGSRERQRGLTLVGFLFVAAVVLIAALVAFRMAPAYIEWYTVQRALENAVKDTTDPTLNNIRRSMERKLNADYADAVSARDVEVTRQGNNIVASVSWQKKLPLVANVSLLLDFDASASR
jgi:Tfp pilus assembly protein PilE